MSYSHISESALIGKPLAHALLALQDRYIETHKRMTEMDRMGETASAVGYRDDLIDIAVALSTLGWTDIAVIESMARERSSR